VTPEAREHLDKAREYPTKARAMLEAMHYSDEAARRLSGRISRGAGPDLRAHRQDREKP